MFRGIKKSKLIAGAVAIAVLVAIIIALAVILSKKSVSENSRGWDDESVAKSAAHPTSRRWGNIFESESALGVYAKGAVSANGRECSPIGKKMLSKGGSAVDAAIAALLCEGICSLHSMGLGGGFLMTIWDPADGGRATYLDARETAPAAATENMFDGDANASMYGGKAVAVPGELLGYWEAHKKYGKLRWSDLFEPAIELCKTGAVVNNYLAESLSKKAPLIRATPSLAEILIDPRTNHTWTVGDRIKRPRLAETLKTLAQQHDMSIFYNGTMGQQLIKEIKAFGGIMEMKDLQNYRVKWKEPIVSKLGNMTMYTAPPPGSGVILTFMLKVLRDLVPTDNEQVFWQRIVETFKWAYAKRTELADPDFENIDGLMANLTSDEYANEIRRSIKDDWTSQDPKYYGATLLPIEDSGTAHISVLAPDGSAVSVTSTINQVLGAMIRSTSTGIIFNDEMDDFSSPNITNGFNLPPSPANFIKPGKRPLSSMTPTIVVDEHKKVRLVIGAAGGTKITTAIASTMILNLFAGYNVKEAVDARRLHHQLIPMSINNEPHFNESILTGLRQLGHKSKAYSGIGSAITVVAQSNGRVTANSDYRRQGSIDGY